MTAAASIPTDLKKTHLKVLAWTDHFFGDDYLKPICVSNPDGEDIHLEFISDRSQIAVADALWFHGPSITDMPPRSQKIQPWVLMSMESDVNYPSLKNPIVARAFDMLMTYRLDADIPCTYPNWQHYEGFLNPPPDRVGPSSGALAVYIASNPVEYRDSYAEALMQCMQIDSLGSCLNNRNIDDFVKGGWTDGAWQSIFDVMPQYKFYLAFENSRATDYVTERVFHALACGTVPIYLGAANVRDFMPADDAIICAADFDSPAQLADYIKRLDGDDEAYARHLAWKHQGYSETFSSLVDAGSVDPQQRLAIKLAHGCDYRCCCGGRRRERGELP